MGIGEVVAHSLLPHSLWVRTAGLTRETEAARGAHNLPKRMWPPARFLSNTFTIKRVLRSEPVIGQYRTLREALASKFPITPSAWEHSIKSNRAGPRAMASL